MGMKFNQLPSGGDKTHTCTQCGETKSVLCFERRSDMKKGILNQCKTCRTNDQIKRTKLNNERGKS